MSVEFLSWDSDFFYRKTGLISGQDLTDNDILENIINAKSLEYKLIYVFLPSHKYIESSILENFSGSLVDRKIIYARSLNNMDTCVETGAVEYKNTFVSEELEALAYLSGQHSRFRVDKNFPEDDFYRLYKTWITKSVNKDLADKIFVVGENHIYGMVTLKYKNSTGDIGLIAVSDDVQGKGYGKDLINACINELLSKDMYNIEVATQEDNVQACKFYERCGFEVKSITNIYHFWL